MEGLRYFLPMPPPKKFSTGPPKMGASGQNFCQIAFEHPEMCEIFKKFRLCGANQVILINVFSASQNDCHLPFIDKSKGFMDNGKQMLVRYFWTTLSY